MASSDSPGALDGYFPSGRSLLRRVMRERAVPGVVGQHYGLRSDWGEQLAFDVIAVGAKRSCRLVPASIRRGPGAEAYQLLSRTERARISAGKRSFEVLA